MFWKICTAYILAIVLGSLYSTLFLDPTGWRELGQTSCLAIIYAATVKFGFPALDSWRAHMRRLREERDRA